MPEETFASGVALRWLRGPFSATVTIGSDFVEVAPTGLLRFMGVQATRADRAEIVRIDRDSQLRSGLRFTTQSGRLDRFVVIPSSSRQRRRIHETLDALGYPAGA